MLLTCIILIIVIVSTIFLIASLKTTQDVLSCVLVTITVVSTIVFALLTSNLIEGKRVERETVSKYYAIKEVLKSDLMQTDNFYVHEKIYEMATDVDQIIISHKKHVNNRLLNGLFSEKIAELEPINLHYSVNKQVIDTTFVK